MNNKNVFVLPLSFTTLLFLRANVKSILHFMKKKYPKSISHRCISAIYFNLSIQTAAEKQLTFIIREDDECIDLNGYSIILSLANNPAVVV